MPFMRRRSTFVLGAPRFITFAISLVIVALALGPSLIHYPPSLSFVTAHRFVLVLAAYGLLALGVLLPGL